MSAARLNQILEPISAEEAKKIEGAFEYIIDTITRSSIDEKKVVASFLADSRFGVLLNFCQKDSRIENFCRMNADFNDIIKNKLDEANHSAMEVIPLDGDLSYSLLELYLAAQFMTKYPPSHKKRADAVDYACQLGSFNALEFRCECNLRLLNNATITDGARKKIIDKIVNDSKRLSTLYGMVGYVRSGCILYAIGQKLQAKQNSDELKKQAKAFRDAAVKDFLCASLLQTNKTSNAIAIAITKGRGVLAIFELIDCQFSNWNEVEVACQKWSTENYIRLMMAAKFEIAQFSAEKTLNKSDIERLNFVNLYLNNFQFFIESEDTILAIPNLIAAALILHELHKNKAHAILLDFPLYAEIMQQPFFKGSGQTIFEKAKTYCLQFVNEQTFSEQYKAAAEDVKLLIELQNANQHHL